MSGGIPTQYTATLLLAEGLNEVVAKAVENRAAEAVMSGLKECIMKN